MSSLPRIGFIGLGIMGKPMARNLMRAGYPLVVLNRSHASMDELVAAGAQAGTSPRDVAAASDVVITMLPDSPDVEAVVLGADGVAAGIKSGALYVDMSTIAPATARNIAQRLRAQGVDVLDAPVSGGEKGAIDAALSIMIGGTDDAFARAEPILRALGKNIVHVGPDGAGQVTKACNQIVVGITIEAVAEALALAAASGVDTVAVRAALLGGFAQSKILEVHGQRMIDEAFTPGFKARLHRKDMNIAVEAGAAVGLELAGAALVRERFDELIADGGGDRDHSALRTLYDAPKAAAV